MKIARRHRLIVWFMMLVVPFTCARVFAQSQPDSPTPFLSPQDAATSPFAAPQQGLLSPDPGAGLDMPRWSDGSSGLVPLNRKSSTAPTMRVSPASGAIKISGLGSSSAPWTIVVLLTILALIPSLMICLTPFARLLVVFHFLRQALGLQTTPSNQTLIGLSLVLTFFIMQPVGEQIYQQAFVPFEAGRVTALDAVVLGSEPLRHFMAHYVREKDAALFVDLAHVPRPRTVDDIPMRVMMPAYIVSELRAGFQIGAVLFLPFLVVDMVVASITTSIGMMQLPPVVISTPLKLMLFLMVDGWHLLVGALMRSFT